MDFEIENELQPSLFRDEKLLWTGGPKKGILFRSTDIFLIPFSLLWFGFAIFWEYGVLSSGISLFALFGIPFILVGFYVTIGRFIIDALKRKKTLYGITKNRIIIKSGLFGKDIKSLNIRTISDITIKEKSDGTGSIFFGPIDTRTSFFQGMDWPGVKQSAGLEFIDDVKTVYAILIEQQNKA